MGQAVRAADNFEVAPTVVLKGREVVFVLEFLWYIRCFDANVLWPVHWCLKVEVSGVEASKFRAWS